MTTQPTPMTGVLLGVQRVPNPQPMRNPDGDCYACALIATFRYLFPDREPPTFGDTDRWFAGQWAEPVSSMKKVIQQVAADPGNFSLIRELKEVAKKLQNQETLPPTDNTWNGFQAALRNARYHDNWPVETVIDMVVPNYNPKEWGYGWPLVFGGDFYVQRLEAWLSAGWVAATVVNHGGNGPFDEELRHRGTDHFLLLDGARSYWKDNDHGASLLSEVHAVDSSKTNLTGWYDVRLWERAYGGSPWILMRRDYR